MSKRKKVATMSNRSPVTVPKTVTTYRKSQIQDMMPSLPVPDFNHDEHDWNGIRDKIIKCRHKLTQHTKNKVTKDIKVVQEQDLDTTVSEPYEEKVEEDELLVTSDPEEAGPPSKCLKGMQKSARLRAPAAVAKKPKPTPSQAKTVCPKQTSLSTPIEDEEPICLVVYIPIPGGSSLHKTILPDANFKELTTLVYSTMGCKEFACKPGLEYKLGNPNSKSQPIWLQMEDDWKGCVEDAILSVKKKKQPEHIYILVSKLYLNSLAAALKKHQKSSSTQPSTSKPSGRKKKKANAQILDLERVSDANDDDDEGGSEDWM